MKSFLIDNWFKLVLTVPCLLVSVYFGIIIYHNFYPKPALVEVETIQDKKIVCLKLGSDARANACLKAIGQPDMNSQEIFGDLFN